VIALATNREGPHEPSFLQFDWRYGDRRGDVRGEGVARYNPLDSLRLDLFTSGEVAMAVALVGGEIRSQGQIEEVEIPPLPLVFAMAGLFRPAASDAPGAYLVGSDSVLVYGGGEVRRYFYLREGRLRRVEDRRHGRTIRRVNVEWPADGRWPETAEYRNLLVPNRVRWTMKEIRSVDGRFPAEVYDLPIRP
jgi:hypothetical protein